MLTIPSVSDTQYIGSTLQLKHIDNPNEIKENSQSIDTCNLTEYHIGSDLDTCFSDQEPDSDTYANSNTVAT